MLYENPVLLTASNKISNRLQVIKNKAIRAPSNVPHYTSTNVSPDSQRLCQITIARINQQRDQQQRHDP